MKRWYDKKERISKQMESLLNASPKVKFKIIKALLDIIHDNADQEIIKRFKVPLDIDTWSRRGYDHEAATWIVINNLKYVDDKVLNKVADYIEKNIDK